MEMKNKIISHEYQIAATDVLDVIKHLPEDTTNKIPQKLISFFESVSIESYKPEIDYSKGLDKIELKEKSKALLAMVYRNYICSNEERENFDKILFENEQKYQEELRGKYNPDKIFENNAENLVRENSDNVQLVEYKEKWYQKLINKILKFLKK